MSHPAALMTRESIGAEIAELNAKIDDMLNDPEFEGHSGSPGESWVERLGELETELKRRQ